MEETKGEVEQKKPPKIVTGEEMALFGKRNCQTCHGAGHYRVRRAIATQGMVELETLCGCAQRRFMKANSAKVYQVKDKMAWKENADAPKAG